MQRAPGFTGISAAIYTPRSINLVNRHKFKGFRCKSVIALFLGGLHEISLTVPLIQG